MRKLCPWCGDPIDVSGCLIEERPEADLGLCLNCVKPYFVDDNNTRRPSAIEREAIDRDETYTRLREGLQQQRRRLRPEAN